MVLGDARAARAALLYKLMTLGLGEDACSVASSESSLWAPGASLCCPVSKSSWLKTVKERGLLLLVEFTNQQFCLMAPLLDMS